MTSEGGTPYLVLRLGSELAALPLAHVRETLRPLRLEPLAGAPDFVMGVAVIRGAPVPVVDLARLVLSAEREAERLVIVELGERRVALAVEGVVGVRSLTAIERAPLPPLFTKGDRNAVESLGLLDSALLLVLETGRLMPAELATTSGEEASW
ncbi:MAG TPA: chemotaxis protein CheW [Polyangiaceae bacterium]